MTNVLVTGANRGIGLELVRRFRARGDTVFATARDPAGAVDLAKTGATLIALDVTDPASFSGLAKVLGETPLDILINNAGIIGPTRQSTLDMDFDGFAQTLAANTLGPLRVAQAVLPNLRRSRNARILTITSWMGTMSSQASDRIAYRTSKAAVNKVMQGLATDLKRENIAVAVAHPGWVRTDMGGSNADLSVEESAAGLVAVVDRLSMAGTGKFYNYDGRELAW
jgi:NAD(P)-dependent dehydrogenase (short-subunit alcohol dehydrogenase family)